MRILYGIQGTGNGHIARARELVPALAKHAELDIVLSGNNYQIQLPFNVRWKLPGLSLAYSASGEVDYWKTFWQAQKAVFVQDVRTLPVKNYNLVISDFEPVTAWACHISRVPCLGVGHQASFRFNETPVSTQKGHVGAWFLQYYAPASQYLGFHFQAYHPDIFPPIIRSDIKMGRSVQGEKIVVYLPAYGKEELMRHFQQLPEFQWHMFAANVDTTYQSNNVLVSPIGDTFVQEVLSARMVLCSAGFELPAELLYLKKPFAVIPIKRQYEQACNAAALEQLGVSVWRHIDEVSNERILSVLERGAVAQVQAASLSQVVGRILDQAGA